MKTAKNAVSTAADQALIAIVEDLIAKELYEAVGFVWAAHAKLLLRQGGYVTVDASPPYLQTAFVRRQKIVGREVQTVDGAATVTGGSEVDCRGVTSRLARGSARHGV
jgi:hypothetical protein